MNETLRQFFKANVYQLLAAGVYLIIVGVGSYVTLQLFEQSATTHIQASDERISKIEVTLYGDGRSGLTTDISVLKTQVSDLHEYFLGR